MRCGATAGSPDRVAQREGPGDDVAERVELRTWAVGTVLAMYDAMNELLRSCARYLRDAAETQEQVRGSCADALRGASPTAAPGVTTA